MTNQPESQHVTWDILLDESTYIPFREPFWLVLKLKGNKVIGWCRSHKSALGLAKRQATLHGYEEYVVLEATHSVQQASQPVPEVDVVPLGETK